ncbi:MAG: Mur ligase family protein [Actinobacteria bacterium]|nr:Mur ligase family protein [Actinomycetota bacterium]
MDRANEILQTRSMFGMELGLERIKAILEVLDNPQRSFAAIHVVGTNGKSSTTRFAAAALAAQGAKVGAYLSPHISGWNERVLIADPRRLPAPIAADSFADAIAAAEAAAVVVDEERGGACTQFEVLTAGAFLALRDAGVEIAVIEAGLGGRLDATNVVNAPVVVLTGVALEHTEHLGTTRELIAAEKLAVLRPGAILVAGGMDDEIRPTIEALAAEHEVTRAMLVAPGMLDDELPDLVAAGSFQRGNAMLALGAAAALVGDQFKVRAAMEAIAKVVVPGRLEVVGRYPLVIRDAAHNPDGARALAGELVRATRGAKPVVGVIALLADKDADGFVAALAGSFDVVIATATESERALPADELMAACAAHGLEVEVVPDPEAALARARFRTGSAGAVVIAGSLTLLAALDR